MIERKQMHPVWTSALFGNNMLGNLFSDLQNNAYIHCRIAAANGRIHNNAINASDINSFFDDDD